MKKYLSLIFVMACCVFLAAPTVMANTYGFFPITDNGNGAALLAPQLHAVVTEVTNPADPGDVGDVRFQFYNAGPIVGSITDIYFDDGSLLGIAEIVDSGAGVAFNTPATPGELPGANNANPIFVTSAGFSADSDSPVSENGAGVGEWVAIIFALQNGQTFNDVIGQLDSGELRMGLHVQAIGTAGGSDAFVNDGEEGTNGKVPEPATLLLLGSGLVGLAGYGRKKIKK
jgi:hypothetical protein